MKDKIELGIKQNGLMDVFNRQLDEAIGKLVYYQTEKKKLSSILAIFVI